MPMAQAMAGTTVPSGRISLADFTKRARDKASSKVGGREPLENAPRTGDAAWKKVFDVAEKYDNSMCKTFNDHIDTVLVFAGLFSAVVTAFTIESYKWLHDDTGDATVQLLAQIATTPPPRTTAWSNGQAARINAVWFSSLLFSLSSAFLAILARQWVLEFERRYRQNYRKGLAVRQAKLLGFEEWNVEHYASTYPLLLLQVALALFVTGVLELLWILDKRVAIPAIVVSSLLAAIYTATTILPCLQFVGLTLRRAPAQRLNPYQSPQAWLFLTFFMRLFEFMKRLVGGVRSYFNKSMTSSPVSLQHLRDSASWNEYAVEWTVLAERPLEVERRSTLSREEKFAFDAIAWLLGRMDSSELAVPAWECLWMSAATKDTSEPISEDLDRVISRLGSLVLPGASYSVYKPRLRLWVFLLDLANLNNAAPALIFELLYLAQHVSIELQDGAAAFGEIGEELASTPDGGTRSLRVRLQPTWMLALVKAADKRLPPKQIDEHTCRYLLSVLMRADLWGTEHHLLEACSVALRILALSDSLGPEHRKGLGQEICTLILEWLGPKAKQRSSWEVGESAARLIIQVLAILEINPPEVGPVTPETIDVARLAKGLEDASPVWIDLVLSVTSDGEMVRAYKRLIEIAETDASSTAAPSTAESDAAPGAGATLPPAQAADPATADPTSAGPASPDTAAGAQPAHDPIPASHEAAGSGGEALTTASAAASASLSPPNTTPVAPLSHDPPEEPDSGSSLPAVETQRPHIGLSVYPDDGVDGASTAPADSQLRRRRTGGDLEQGLGAATASQ